MLDCGFSYKPREYYEQDEELKKAIDQIRGGVFSPRNPNEFEHLVNDLLNHDR